MTAAPRFDFRDYLRNRNPAQHLPGNVEHITFGAAVSNLGLALVALHPGAFSPSDVDRYANIVFGPVEGDLSSIASEIARLPDLLASSAVRIFLYADAGCEDPQARAILAKLLETFADRVTLLPAADVQQWIGARIRRIRPPNIPPAHQWCTDLIARAAKTALYAEFEFADECDDAMVFESPDISCPDRLDGKRHRIAAAAYTKPYLSIVTMESEGGQIRLDEERCAALVYDERDSAAAKGLSAKLGKIFHEFGIDHVVLRTAAEKGRFAASAHCYKVEAILQLLPEIEVESVTSQSVSLWQRNNSPEIPLPQSEFDSKWRQAQQRAIELAAYALSPQFKNGVRS